MARICEGPTLAARKLGLASFSPGQRPDSICGATSDLGSHFGYLDGRPFRCNTLAGPLGDSCNVAKLLRAAGTCRSSEASRSPLLDGQAMVRFSPTWDADCPGIPSPG
jgi:hypothetical protein